MKTKRTTKTAWIVKKEETPTATLFPSTCQAGIPQQHPILAPLLEERCSRALQDCYSPFVFPHEAVVSSFTFTLMDFARHFVGCALGKLHDPSTISCFG